MNIDVDTTSQHSKQAQITAASVDTLATIYMCVYIEIITGLRDCLMMTLFLLHGISNYLN